MKKTAIALAVAAFAAAPAMADGHGHSMGKVTLSGTAEYDIVSTNADNDELHIAEDDPEINVVATMPLNNDLTGKIAFELDDDNDGSTSDIDVEYISLSSDRMGTFRFGETGAAGTEGRLSTAIDGDIEISTSEGVGYKNTFGSVTIKHAFSSHVTHIYYSTDYTCISK